MYSPLAARQPHGRQLHDLVRSIGLATGLHDGNDVFAVAAAVKAAVQGIRHGGAPVFLEFLTYRHLEHCGPFPDDNLGYRPEKDVAAWKARDPVALAQEKVRDHPEFSGETVDRWRSEIAAEIEDAFTFARTTSWPEQSTRAEYVYA